MEYQSLESRNLLAAITVDTLTDNGDGADGLISLREAITATNTNAAFGDAPAGDESGDSIRIDPALAGQTITLSDGIFSSGQLVITDDLIIRGFGTTIEAGAGSRIFSINTSEDVVLSRLNLENGDVTQERVRERLGGAVRFEGGGTLRLFQSQFSNNSARFGGAIYAAGGNVLSFESTFSNNASMDATLSSAGGALFLAGQSATAIILGSTFEGNVAELGNGGAISAGGSDRIFAFSTDFTNNTANADGSERDAFFDDTGDFGGGAIFTRGFLRTGQSTFTDNSTSDGSGGAINAGGSRFVVGNTSFENNVADTFGGAVYLESGIISRFNNARFSNNEATSAGGALVVADPFLDPAGEPFDLDEPPSRLDIRASSFSDNRSQTGGAIFFASNFFEGQAVISGTTFRGNNVDGPGFPGGTVGTGGAIFNTAGKLQIFNSSFENNEARDQNSTTDAGSRGGAVYSVDGEVDIAFSSFSGNKSDFGGAVAIISLSEDSEATIFESEFRNNRAGLPVGDPRLQPNVTQSVGDGGAIFSNSTFNSNATIGILGGLFENNIATDSGGAVAAGRGFNEIVVSPSRNGATQFIGNRALAGDGGAISNPLSTRIRDAVFSENTARNGGGIFVDDPNVTVGGLPLSGQLRLSGAQITENEARVNGGGVFLASNATFINNSSNISSNTATNGADIFEA